jgi:hypothetical protein
VNQCSEDRPEHQPKPVVAIAEKVAEAYSSLGILRAVVPYISGVGPAIDAMLGTRGQNIAMRRLQSTIDELKRQAQALDETTVDREFLQSEDFYDLIWRVLEKGQRTVDEEKVRLYIRVLLRSAWGVPHRESAEEYLNLLSDLSPTEIHLASILFYCHPDTRIPTGEHGHNRRKFQEASGRVRACHPLSAIPRAGATPGRGARPLGPARGRRSGAAFARLWRRPPSLFQTTVAPLAGTTDSRWLAGGVPTPPGLAAARSQGAARRPQPVPRPALFSVLAGHPSSRPSARPRSTSSCAAVHTRTCSANQNFTTFQ